MTVETKLCHFCGKDLSKNGIPKHMTHFSHELPKNAVLCSICFEKDFGLSKHLYTCEKEKEEGEKEKEEAIAAAVLSYKKQMKRFHKLFGNFYFKL